VTECIVDGTRRTCIMLLWIPYRNFHQLLTDQDLIRAAISAHPRLSNSSFNSISNGPLVRNALADF